MFEEVPLTKITIGPRFRQDLGDIAGLAASIETLGLLHPIIVTTEYALVVGRRRLAAHEHLGRSAIEARVIDLDDPMAAEVDENEKRKNYTISEWLAIGEAREERDRVKAQQRKSAGGKKAGRGRSIGGVDSTPPIEKAKARDVTAGALSMGWQKHQRAKAVCKAARDDAAFQDLVEEMDRTGNVTRVYNKLPPYMQHKDPTTANGTKARVIKPMRYSALMQRIDTLMQGVVIPRIRFLDAEDRENLRKLLTYYLEMVDHVEDDNDGE
jgi:ParB-like nuclease domain